MPPALNSHAQIQQRVEMIIRRDLKLGPDVPITPDMPFFGGDADIDSLDILLLLSSVEKEFGLRIPSEKVGREVFANVGTLVSYIEEHANTGSAATIPLSNSPALNEVLARLPHGEAFRFITQLTQLNEGQSAEAIWKLTGSESFFAGHSPGNPLVPGVLIAESLAQVSGLASGMTSGQARLAQVDMRFEQPVTPPAEIRLESRVARTIGSLKQFDVSAFVGQTLIARGHITLSFS
jgi:3-hydroxyacyl-[acyl-carrier-protein] dehydratase